MLSDAFALVWALFALPSAVHGYCPAGFEAVGNNCYTILKVMESYAEAQNSSIYSETAAANYGSADIFNSYIPKVPAQRLGRVEEVSSCVCYLLSPAASFISGETVKVDAGASLYSTMWTIPDHHKLPAYSWDNDSSVVAADDDNDDSSGSGTKSKL